MVKTIANDCSIDSPSINRQGHAGRGRPGQAEPAVGSGPDRRQRAFLAQDQGVAHLAPQCGIHRARVLTKLLE